MAAEQAGLLKDEILKCADLPRETVAVPEWGGIVILRALTAYERERWEMDWAVPDSKRGLVAAALVAASAVDAQGGRLFAEVDIESLARKSGAALGRLWRVARRLSGIGPEARDETEKN